MKTLILLLPITLVGETHKITATQYYNAFSRFYPVLAKIKPGDTVVTKTIDAWGADENLQRRADPPNPLTGPFFIEGAEAGDALVIHFRRIRMNRNSGWSGYRLGLFSLTANSVEGVYASRYKDGLVHPGRADRVPWDLDLTRQTVRLRDPVSKVHKMEFPARPMLGCVGVAAQGDFSPNSGISGPYGGNMDYNEIVEGSTVMLPVYHPGGLLFIGDGHALQADGEPTGTGVETSMDVEFSVELRKKANLGNPRVENSEFIISVGSQPEFVSALNHTLQIATSDMVRWLTQEYGMEPWAAHLLIGYQGRYDVITVAGSMGLKISKKVLPPRR
ncbi:MAG: acetamidase/formamidase family protein [Bryobacteraceae bacterium]